MTTENNVSKPRISAPRILAARGSMTPKKIAAKPQIVVKTGKVMSPVKGFFYGEKGVGKSTLLSSMPKPIVASSEHSHDELGTDRVECATWEELIATVDMLTDTQHEWKSFGVDTMDWAEALLHDYITREHGIKDLSAKYGAGYKQALMEWRNLLAKLETLHRKKGMHIALIAHMEVKQIDNPMGVDFTKYQPKLRDKAYALFGEWSSIIGFACRDTVFYKSGDDDSTKGKAVGTGVRILRVDQSTGGYEAKNRYRMPDKIPLSWEVLYGYVEKHFKDRNTPEAIAERARLTREIHSLLPSMEADKAAAITEWLKDDPDADDLQITLNKMKVLVSDSSDDVSDAGDETTEAPEAEPEEGEAE